MDQTCNVLSLATGAGGLDLGVHMALRNARTVCAVEIEAYACEVLAERMAEGRLDDAPIWTDLRSFDGRPWRGVVDLVIGGYPCQPFSLAGKRLGADDPRHLWPHVARIIREVQPGAVFFENVLGHVSLGLDLVVRELCEMGYRVEAGIFSAAEVGAPHKRSRVFILGVADSPRIHEREPEHGPCPLARQDPREGAGGRSLRMGEDVADAHREPHERHGEPGELPGPRRAAEDEGRERQRGRDAAHGGLQAMADARGDGPQGLEPPGAAQEATVGGGRAALADAHLGRLQGERGGGVLDRIRPALRDDADGCGGTLWLPGPGDRDGWAHWSGPQPAVRRDADGLAHRVDRLRLCGNGVVPAQAALAFRTLWKRM